MRVGDTHARQILAAEHEVELREAEYEGIAAVDDRDVDLVGHLVRQHGRQFQAGEPGAQYEHGLHRISFLGFAIRPPREVLHGARLGAVARVSSGRLYGRSSSPAKSPASLQSARSSKNGIGPLP